MCCNMYVNVCKLEICVSELDRRDEIEAQASGGAAATGRLRK